MKIISGTESIFLVPSLHSDTVDLTILLEICGDHCGHFGHFSHCFCLGDQKGGYIYQIARDKTEFSQQNRNLRDKMKSESKVRVIRNNRGSVIEKNL